MTMATERYKSLIRTKKFLRELQNPEGNWKNLEAVRKEAASCLRHYPWEMHLEDLAADNPDILEREVV
jgi:hypothetical protein